VGAGRKAEILPGVLEQLALLPVPEVSVHNTGYRHEMKIRVPDGATVEMYFDRSNSGRTLSVWGHRRNSLLKEWDEKKVQAMVISHLVPRESGSYEAQMLRELRRYSLPVPAILDPIVREIHKTYVKEMGGEDLERRVAEAAVMSA
jgi:hypothetical protein